MYEIVFFEGRDNRKPFEEYLSTLGDKLRAKTLRSVQLLREFGPELREPNTKHIGDGLFELRTIMGSNIGRSFFFFYDGHRIVITHGFIKKTKRTPPKEIKLARQYRDKYLADREQEE